MKTLWFAMLLVALPCFGQTVCEICGEEAPQTRHDRYALPNAVLLDGGGRIGDWKIDRYYTTPTYSLCNFDGKVIVCEHCYNLYQADYNKEMLATRESFIKRCTKKESNRIAELKALKEKQAEIDRQQKIRELKDQIYRLEHPEKAAEQSMTIGGFIGRWVDTTGVLPRSIDSVNTLMPLKVLQKDR